MKKIIFALNCILLTILVNAQTEKEDIAIVQSIFGKTKKSIIMEYVPLTDGERTPFWKLYGEYEDKYNIIWQERIKLIEKFAKSYDSLNETNAVKLAEAFLENTSRSTKLYREYLKKFDKKIGGVRAATIVQIELYVQTAIQASLQSQIPVIGELEKLQKQTGTK